MKILSKLKFIVAIITFSSLTISCNEETSELNTELNDVDLTTIGVINGNPIFSQFAKAIELAELSETLKNIDSHTIFVPGNEAFNSFLKTTIYATINDVPKDVLKQIVLYHVLKDQTLAKEFITGSEETLATGSSSENNLTMSVSIASGVVLNNDAKVINADLKASNGVVHVVDKVIKIPTTL